MFKKFILIYLFSNSVNACDLPLSNLSLEDVITVAICNHPQLEVAKYAIEDQEYGVLAAKSQLYPTLDGNFRIEKRLSDPSISNQSVYSANSWGGQAQYLLFDGGGRTASIKQAIIGLEVVNKDRELISRKIISDVIKSYYDFATSINNYQATLDELKNQKQLLDSVRTRLKIGLATKADEVSANASYLKSVSDSVSTEERIKLFQSQLLLSMGILKETKLNIKEQSVLQNAAKETLLIEGFVQSVMQNHPQLQRIDSQIRVQQQQLIIERSRLRPSLSLSASYNSSDNSLPFTVRQNNGVLGLSVLLPFFDGGKSKNLSKQAEMKEQRLLQEKETSLLSIVSVLAQYRNEINGSLATYEATKLAVDAAKTSLEFELGKYKGGVGNVLDVTNAQARLTDAKRNMIANYYLYQKSKSLMVVELGNEQLFGGVK